MINLINIIELNQELNEKFTYDQLLNIIDVCYQHDINFAKHVKSFYTDIMPIDNKNDNIIFDICKGDYDGFVHLAEDINYYCNK